MLKRMRSALGRKRPSASSEISVDHVAAADAYFSEQIGLMPTLWPPEPVNDDPMAGAVEEVERELRIAGYLR